VPIIAILIFPALFPAGMFLMGKRQIQLTVGRRWYFGEKGTRKPASQERKEKASEAMIKSIY